MRCLEPIFYIAAMFAIVHNLPELLRMLWYWARVLIRNGDSRSLIGPLGAELKGEAHLRTYTYLCTFLVGSLLALPAAGQSSVAAEQLGASVALPAAQGQETSTTPSEVPAAAPAAPQGGSAPPTWSVGPINFSGAVDAYYSYNANHPGNMTSGLYNFDDKTNQFNLSLVKLAMSHDPDPVGFRVDLGYGRTMELVNCCDPDGGFNKYVEQAYVSWKPKGGKGFQADFGKWVTSAGAEVIESYSNWNYSRSLAFVLALPYYHFGLRTSMPMGSHFTGGFQVTNGWNNLTDNNSGKTVGFTGAFTSSKANFNVNYYYGPENTGTNVGKTSLIDTILTLTPTSKVSAYINYDYGQSRDQTLAAGGQTFGAPIAYWQAFATALHFQPTSKWSFSPRGEWFQDRQGVRTGFGSRAIVTEVTFTGEYKMAEGLLWRAEYRHDWSPYFIFQRGAFGATTKQDTFTVGFVAFFGPMR